MAAEHASEYKDLVVFLAAAGVLVPIFSRFKVSPVLGFLAAGVLLGPDGLGRFADVAPWVSWLTITDRTDMAVLAELGVAFLLFMIGLELSWGRLKTMRKLVFGLGVSQVLACTAALSGLFLLMGQTLDTALVAGMALALSSTAIVMPVLAERSRVGAGSGRATFSVLLAQDLAVAPSCGPSNRLTTVQAEFRHSCWWPSSARAAAGRSRAPSAAPIIRRFMVIP